MTQELNNLQNTKVFPNKTLKCLTTKRKNGESRKKNAK